MSDLRDQLAAALGDAYRIEQELGGGGMSRVFLAEEVQLGRQVVVKVLPPELGAGVNAERFRREIQLAARLQHPHVVPLIAAGQDGELFWYTMPFIMGESLRARLARERELPVAEAVRLLRDVADALTYAHEQGVVHRDIKPDNILISGHHAVVTDFGVAKAISAATGPNALTSAGIALGTPAYMAPEQASADPHTDHRADIYALGALAYEMLTGKPPFEGGPAVVLAAHVTQAPAPVTDRRPSVPPALAALVMRCLEKKPADRYQQAAELHGVLDGMATPSGGMEPTSAVPATAVRPATALWPRRRIAGIAAAVIVVAGIAGAVLLNRPGGTVVRQATRMAIMPFGSATGDSALGSLGRNLVVLLSASLDGVGEIRTVEPTTILGRSATAPSLDEAFGHARALGAASVVYGTLVPLGRQVRLDAAFYDTETRELIARAGASGPLDNMAQLADSAAWALLNAVWRAREAPTVSVGALTGRPLAAVREFVEGERALARSGWEVAAEHYRRAMEVDSTFWLAYRRYAYAMQWTFQPVPASVHDAYREHRAELPARERDLVAALMTVGTGPRIDSLRAVATRYPDFWPAWLEYADLVFHHGARVGARAEDIVQPWEHLRQIHPAFSPTYEHLIWARASLEDSTGTQDAIAEWRAISKDSSLGYGFDMFSAYRTIVSLRIHAPLVDTALVDSYADIVSTASEPFSSLLAVSLLHTPAAYGVIASWVERGSVPALGAARLRRAAALAMAARGAWPEGLGSLARLGDGAAYHLYEYAAVGSAVGDWTPRDAGLGATPTTPRTTSADDRIRLAWADGLMAYARRDRAAMAAARRAATAASHRRSAYVDSSLAVLQRDLDGDRPVAIDALLALERAYADSSVVDPPTIVPVNRVLLGRWLVAAGRAADADWALEALDAVIASPDLIASFGVLNPVARFHRGVAAEALGEYDRARRFYRRFLYGYDLPPPQHRAWVDSARAALGRL